MNELSKQLPYDWDCVEEGRTLLAIPVWSLATLGHS